MDTRPAPISGHEAGGYEDPGAWYGEQADRDAERRAPVRVPDPGRGLTTTEGAELEQRARVQRRELYPFFGADR